MLAVVVADEATITTRQVPQITARLTFRASAGGQARQRLRRQAFIREGHPLAESAAPRC